MLWDQHRGGNLIIPTEWMGRGFRKAVTFELGFCESRNLEGRTRDGESRQRH